METLTKNNSGKILRKNFFSKIFLGALLAALAGVYFFFDPLSAGFFPGCMLHSLTGLDCPGCGSQRAFHALLHFDFAKALEYNPLFVLAIPYAGTALILNDKKRRSSFPVLSKIVFGRHILPLILAVVILFFIFRNWGKLDQLLLIPRYIL